MVDINKFIEEYIDLIEADRWSDIYNIFNGLEQNEEQTGDLTRMLLSAGIDPIKQGNLNFVPAFYMLVNDETNPEKINITEYEIPEGVINIMDYAFWGNNNLQKIIIPHSMRSIRQHAFGKCPNLTIMEYKGTWEEWKAADTIKTNYDFLGTNELICSDGTYNRFTGKKLV